MIIMLVYTLVVTLKHLSFTIEICIEISDYFIIREFTMMKEKLLKPVSL